MSGCGEERKVVTVLFADLVGFTSRAEQMDPEDVRALLSPYYARLRSELERFGGTVEKFIGDAVLALFGAPATHEDDPERAVRAALAIRDWARAEGQIEVRLAVHTGEALIVLGARPDKGEGMAAGDVVNTAARLQAAAPVNGILVSDRTFRATREMIEYRPAGPVAAKGKRAPVTAWEAVAARSANPPWTPQTVMVGREQEVGVLRDTLARVIAERCPQLITLVGAPGVGKSRLLYELGKIAGAAPEPVSWRQGRSLPYGGSGFWALAEMVKAQAGILDSDTGVQAEAKLARTVADVMPGEAEPGRLVRHLAALAGVAHGAVAHSAVAHGADAADRGEVFAAWRQFIEALAERWPLVLAFENLHWADDGLLDFVDYLADRAIGVPLLMIATARPELLARRPQWSGGKPNALTLTLARLSSADTARLVDLLAGPAVLTPDRRAALLAHADGNPLYAEQYVRMLADQRTAPDAALPVPESVQGIIGARLDLLPPDEKGLLHDAAVIGRVFWPGAVAALGDRRAATAALADRLHALERKQFIRRERASTVAGQTQYGFTHVLVRDVAYGQIPRAARSRKHAAAAAWIESLGRPDDNAEMLAHHYQNALELARAAGLDAAELVPRARRALHAAGDRAFALRGTATAAGYYRAALALWPPDALRERAELLWPLGLALAYADDGDQAKVVLAEGAAAAAAAGLTEVSARIRTLLMGLQGRAEPSHRPVPAQRAADR